MIISQLFFLFVLAFTIVYIPERLTPSFRFGLTPLFRTFDPQNVNNIPEV